VNREPAAADASNRTTVPLLKVSEQSPGQAIPAGLDVTVPPPPTDTLSTDWFPNVAVTDPAALMVSAHVAAVPEHPDPQPAKCHPAAGLAVSVTAAPGGNTSVQSPGQSMPAGWDVTPPPPAS
jgi:hypothetical protein